MTISSEAAPQSFNGDDVTVGFAIPWKYFAKSHVVATLRDSSAVETTQILATDYTLTDAGVDAGGTLTMTTAPATGETLVITLEPPNTQDSSLPRGGEFPSPSVEDGLDLAAQRDSKNQDVLDRGIRVPRTDTQSGDSLEIPIDSDRASKFLAFDVNGKVIASVGSSEGLGPVTAYINTLLDDANAAEAMSTLFAKGSDIISAATLVLSEDGNYIDVTGSTGPITAITVEAGRPFILQFDSTPTLTHHATNLNLPGEQNIVVAAGDRMLCFATAANQVTVIGYSGKNRKGTAVASAATTNIWAEDCTTLHVTGSTGPITSFGTAPRVGEWRKVIFDSTPTLTHSANLNLQGGENITMEAGDYAFIFADTATQFDVLIVRKSGVSVISDFQASIRQTVLSGAVAAATGFANFISAGTGLACDIAATTTNVVPTYAAGFNVSGPVNKSELISADVSSAWSSLTANAENFLYRENAVGYGNTVNLPPVYGPTYVKAGGVGRSYDSFDGTDGATSSTDANPDVTTVFNGTAQLDTAQKKFGTASALLDGNSDYIDKTGLTVHAGENEGGCEFTGLFRLNATGVIQTVFHSITDFHFGIHSSATEKLTLSLGNGSSWTIASASAGSTTLATATWYFWRLIWDGATYKLYLSNNGAAETEEVSVTSSTAFAAEPNGYRLGAEHTPAVYFNGWIEDVSYAVGPQTVGTETPAAYARGSLADDQEHWFDTTRMVMSYWDQATAAWVDTQRVFMGEATTDGSSVTNAVTYQLRGEYIGPLTTFAYNTQYSISHNLGVRPKSARVYMENIVPPAAWGYLPGDRFEMTPSNGSAGGASTIYNENRNAGGFVVRTALFVSLKGGGNLAGFVVTEWKYVFEASRGW